ncbi:MAG: molybdopterin-dependent oxidoreductase [Solirubrobacterales bacterium]|nr:molybdopterin-dependent oxidoreductase [Solirubrobacterales bacterium]
MLVGESVPRLEDGRLLRGFGRFVDDVDLPGQLHLHVVRSDVAHARVRAIHLEAAAAAPSVRLAVAAADLDDVPLIPLRLDFGVELDPFLQPVLATDRVRYVGEPVAAIVAEDRYAAEDAAGLVEVEYEPLDVVLDPRAAIEADAPSLWKGSGNEAAELRKSFGDVEAAFADAAHVVSAELRTGRHTGVPLETRGLTADWDPGRAELTVWGAALVTHYHRRVLSRLLGIPINRIHMRGTDAGGNFGVRGDFFPEDFLIPWLARRLGRPVKWTEDRGEHLVAINHAREQVHRIDAAFDQGARLLGLRDEIWHNKGAYIRPTGIVVSEISIGMIPWPYRVPAYEGVIHAVMTNKTPVGPYRAPGRFENTFAREQLFNIAADELGVDPVELRRANLLTCEDLPHAPGLSMGGEPFVLNSGDFTGLLERAHERAGFAAWRRESERLRRDGRLVGSGIAYFMDKSGLGVYETAEVEVGADGGARLLIGGASSGQGIETVMAQIAGDALTIPLERIDVVHGDTDLIPDGVGSWSSRSTVIGGSAVLRAAEATREQALRVAAELLEASTDDLVLADGRVHVRGSGAAGLDLGEIAAACDAASSRERGDEPGLGAREIYVDPMMNYPYGVALCQLELDPSTGAVEVWRYFVAYEAGRAVNPALLRGQIVGGAVQGLGGALFEELAYADSGQPQTTSLIDYLLPGATETPREFDCLICEDAPTPTNPLGAKGAGESGIMAVGAAVAGAVSDALGAPAAVTRLPLTPEEVRSLIERTRAEREAEEALV